MGKRSISDSFLKTFKKKGVFHPIVELVKVDPYLDLELRGNSVMIYYRGGKILTIEEKGLKLKALDKKYYTKGCPIVCPQPSIENIYEYLYKAKFVVDFHEAAPRSGKLGEKEFQQRIVYENNLSVIAKNTDYFIADVEWADKEELEGRADIVAFRWDHMNHIKREIQMVLIEVKQGEKAIKTSVDNNGKVTPGLRKHYDDFLKFKNNKEYASAVRDDMYKVLLQKRELGLVKGLELLDIDGRGAHKNVSFVEEPEFLFALCNYHHYGNMLANESEQLPADCKFILSSFLGHGLYKDFIRTKEQMIQEFPYAFLKQQK